MVESKQEDFLSIENCCLKIRKRCETDSLGTYLCWPLLVQVALQKLDVALVVVLLNQLGLGALGQLSPHLLDEKRVGLQGVERRRR